jgi:predicted dehydrogenase
VSASTNAVPIVRWGVLATGRIAATVSRDLDHVPGAVRHAVASRDAARAGAFAREHGFAVSYGSYAELVEDRQVDVVYVATPHPQHLAAAELALRAGTPVLVEKPVTATLAGAERLVALARETGTFCMEAMWTRFLPNGVRLAELVRDGAVGDVRTVHADLGFRAPDDPTSRYFSPALGGGALLDVGVYPIALAQQLLGAPEHVQVSGDLTATGVDGHVALLLRGRTGASALLSASITSHAASAAWVEGTDGRIEVPRSFERMPALHVSRAGGETEVVDLGRHGTGYAHMLEHVQSCLAGGLAESPVMPLSDTLDVMRVVDTAQRALGLGPRDDG